jgi:hypothetical protein
VLWRDGKIRQNVVSSTQKCAQARPREGGFEMAVTKASLWQAVKNIVTLGRAAKKK